ncbi:SAM-dependent methyltransferase TehB [Acerihabitans arboris]|uniref:SAM-dependent methyltransferase TehB n=1 Tax=Acerihabitans arboris TaxID=2691583 RepID=A0A845SFJ9_9GAMM|nr:SAM-dependent methyltransferase TehB [Acerihabitans arboris]NDL63610.1 SAM-dependent methyltransferase TehB [Acerihabitans arboris]
MQDLMCYKTMPEWDSRTLPETFRQRHNTQEGVWAKLTVLQGRLSFAFLGKNDGVLESCEFTRENQPPLVEPQRWHRIVDCSGDMRCRLEFYCRPEDYYHIKHGMTRTHSEVINAAQYLPPGKALDLGCGAGRNALYLNGLGFDVTAYDKNQQSIDALKTMIDIEHCEHISASVYDINEQLIEGRYDFILSTVVLMFLQADKIDRVIRNMQQSTNGGGLNLIVAAMSTGDYPCPLPFPFTFSAGELPQYYHDWEILKYNEDVGELHKTDAQGNRIKLRFATLLARKRP